MKGKTVEVAPFDSYTYTVVNRYTKARFGPFDSLLEAKEYIHVNFRRDWWGDRFSDTFNLTKDERNAWMFDRLTPKPGRLRRPFVIVTQYGDIVSLSDIADAGYKPYRNFGWEDRWLKREITQKSLVKTAGNPHKIKSEWAYVETWDNWGQKVDYSNEAQHYYRRIRTHRERTANEACDNEYGPELVRGKRRGRNLPTSWEERPSGMFGLAKCWKHNSKRRKQYKTK